MVKIKLFLADTKSYVSLNLNQSARNTHLFKLIGELSSDNVTLKKNWIWDVLEIRWVDTHIMLNSKEIYLPTTLLVLLIHKLKVRKLLGKRVLCRALCLSELFSLSELCLGVNLLHVCRCTAIHNCSSSGSLFFTTLRWYN